MTKIKFARLNLLRKYLTRLIIPISLLVVLVLVGAGCFEKSPEAFYEKVCKISIDFSEELDDVLDQEFALLGGEDDLDDCIDDMIEQEEDLYDECMDEEDDEDVCNEVIGNYRSIIENFLTRQGCLTIYSSYCSMHQATGEYEDFNECIDDVSEVCKALPRSF